MKYCEADRPTEDQMKRIAERLSDIPDDDVLEENARIIKALADPTRLKIIHILSRGELCVCEIMAALEKPQPTVSHHLNILKREGFLESKKVGVWVHYRLKDEDLASKIQELIKPYLRV